MSPEAAAGPSSPPLASVCDTAHWVAFYRALESERRDALFHDPFARRLAGERGERIVRLLSGGRGAGWAMAVRTVLFDEVIRRAVEEGEVGTVLNLAAGLDTRAYRLPLPARLRWLDVDLPHMLAYKQQVLEGERPRCVYEAVGVDLTVEADREALFARVGAASRQVLVVTEGLLIYLRPEQVFSLAQALHRQPSFRWWLTDLASPGVARMLTRRWGRLLSSAKATFHFAPAEGSGFFAPAGWREVVFRSMWEESKRLHRQMRWAWLWRLLASLASPQRREQFRRMSGVVLLERV